jgi:transposase InsO family protein
MVSMARTGSSYENGMMESFFKTLKHEEVYLCQYGTREDVMDRLPHFVEEVYNRKRLHSALGYLPPNEFEGLLSIDLGRQLPRKTLRTLSVQS